MPDRDDLDLAGRELSVVEVIARSRHQHAPHLASADGGEHDAENGALRQVRDHVGELGRE
jgi:hypothetical protein